MAAANEIMANTLPRACTLLPEETVTGVGVVTGGFVDWGTPPVGGGVVAFAEAGGTAVLVTGGAAAPHSEDVGMMALDPSTLAKLAQVMRVTFAKCSTKLRLPKKALSSAFVDANWS